MTTHAEIWMQLYRELRSEPLSQKELAELFGVGRRYVRTLLEAMDDVQEIGTGQGVRYRVPVRNLPPKYFVDRGLVLPDAPPRAA